MGDFDSQLPIRSDSADAAINVEEFNGNTVSTGTGTVDSGTVRVTQATDVPVNVDVDSVAGTSISTNTGTVDSGTIRVTLATDVAVPVDFDGVDKTNNLQYDTAVAVAAGSSSNHIWSPSADFKLCAVHLSGSGQAKMEVKTGVTSSETTKMVKFTNKANLNAEWRLCDPLLIQATDTIIIIRTNTEPGQPQDLYSTIEGYDV